MDVLKTGDRFTAKSKLGDEYEYEFVGIDLLDAGSVPAEPVATTSSCGISPPGQ